MSSEICRPRLDAQRLGAALDTGEELALTWEEPPSAVRATLRHVLRGLVLLVSLAMLLAGGFLLGTVFNLAHTLRGLHQDSPSCGSTRGNCTDPP